MLECDCLNNYTDAEYSTHARRNGWTWPPNPLQITAWILTALFTLFHFGIICPSFVTEWQPIFYISVGIGFVVFVAFHVAACAVDPADDNVRKMPKKNQVPKLDRKEFPKVIEDQYCYVCETNVTRGAKHCSLCQKCVQDFDHHCRWLNNCVGGRNYRLFIGTLVSAIVACTLILASCITLFTAYFTDVTDGDILIFYRDTSSFRIFHLSVPEEVWLFFIVLTAFLMIVALILLIHLQVFHIKLWYWGLTTYEYIVQERKKEEERARELEVEEEAKTKSSKSNQIAPEMVDNKEKCCCCVRLFKKCKKPVPQEIDIEKQLHQPSTSTALIDESAAKVEQWRKTESYFINICCFHKDPPEGKRRDCATDTAETAPKADNTAVEVKSPAGNYENTPKAPKKLRKARSCFGKKTRVAPVTSTEAGVPAVVPMTTVAVETPAPERDEFYRPSGCCLYLSRRRNSVVPLGRVCYAARFVKPKTETPVHLFQATLLPTPSETVQLHKAPKVSNVEPKVSEAEPKVTPGAPKVCEAEPKVIPSAPKVTMETAAQTESARVWVESEDGSHAPVSADVSVQTEWSFPCSDPSDLSLYKPQGYMSHIEKPVTQIPSSATVRSDQPVMNTVSEPVIVQPAESCVIDMEQPATTTASSKSVSSKSLTERKLPRFLWDLNCCAPLSCLDCICTSKSPCTKIEGRPSLQNSIATRSIESAQEIAYVSSSGDYTPDTFKTSSACSVFISDGAENGKPQAQEELPTVDRLTPEVPLDIQDPVSSFFLERPNSATPKKTKHQKRRPHTCLCYYSTGTDICCHCVDCGCAGPRRNRIQPGAGKYNV